MAIYVNDFINSFFVVCYLGDNQEISEDVNFNWVLVDIGIKLSNILSVRLHRLWVQFLQIYHFSYFGLLRNGIVIDFIHLVVFIDCYGYVFEVRVILWQVLFVIFKEQHVFRRTLDWFNQITINVHG